jgi:hypothetical protein
MSDPLRTRMIELRFFAGLTTDETAEALGVSAATVMAGMAAGARLAASSAHAGVGAARGTPMTPERWQWRRGQELCTCRTR